MTRTLALALLVAAPSTALAAGGGGVTISGKYMPRYGEDNAPHDAPGWMGCVGGVGYFVLGKGSGGFRLGGDGAYCRGSDGLVQASFGGAQLGHWQSNGMFFWSAYAGVGGGVFLDDTTPGYDAYMAAYGYVRPTLSFGVALGPTALEFGAYTQVPINFRQVVGNGDPRGYVTPEVGLQVSFLFGWFRKEAKRHPAPPPVAPCTEEPYGPDCPQASVGPMVPMEQGPPEPQPRYIVVPEPAPAVDERPLAIAVEDQNTNTSGAQAGPVDVGPVQAGPVDVGPVQAGPVEVPVDVGTIDVSGNQINVGGVSCPACPACPAAPDVQVYNMCGDGNSVNVSGGSQTQGAPAAPPPPPAPKEPSLAVPVQ